MAATWSSTTAPGAVARWQRLSFVRQVCVVLGLVLPGLLLANAGRAQVVDTTLWAPDGVVIGVAVSSGRVYAWGMFTSIRGVPRHGLASLDVATGAVTDWDPNPDDGVYAMAVSGSTVHVGGDFSVIGGQSRSRIAALDATSGLATTWDPSANAAVRSLLVSGNTVYAAGSFTSIGGRERPWLAALDGTTGSATGWDPPATGTVSVIARAGPLLITDSGFFRQFAPIHGTMGAVDTVTGALTSWDPNPNSTVRAMAVHGNTVYVGGAFSQIGQTVRSSRYRLAAIDATTGRATAWNPGAGGGVTALAVDQGIVYAGGGFTSIDGANRNYLAALNESDGTATSWNPGATSAINSIVPDGGAIYVGGLFGSICGQPQSFLARMQDSPTGTLLARFDAEVKSEGVLLQWQIQSTVRAVAVERSETETEPWTRPLVEVSEQGEATQALDRTAEPGHSYWYRLVATLADGSIAEFGPIQARVPRSITTSGIVRVAPNPTKGLTHIDYQVVRREPVRVSVVDVAGREAQVLFDGDLAPGRYSAVWDGAGRHGRLPGGVYFIRWQSPSRVMQRRLVLMR